VLVVLCAAAAASLSTGSIRAGSCSSATWLDGILAVRSLGTTDMAFWQSSAPLLLMALGLPFFLVPVTSPARASVDENETASAAGLVDPSGEILRALAASGFGAEQSLPVLDRM
jgi:MFS transporter, DHA2 family, multidrug resistance protein